MKLNKYKASLNFLQRKFLVRIFKIHILYLGARGGSPGGMKLNKYKPSPNFLQHRFLVRIHWCPYKVLTNKFMSNPLWETKQIHPTEHLRQDIRYRIFQA